MEAYTDASVTDIRSSSIYFCFKGKHFSINEVQYLSIAKCCFTNSLQLWDLNYLSFPPFLASSLFPPFLPLSLVLSTSLPLFLLLQRSKANLVKHKKQKALLRRDQAWKISKSNEPQKTWSKNRISQREWLLVLLRLCCS